MPKIQKNPFKFSTEMKLTVIIMLAITGLAAGIIYVIDDFVVGIIIGGIVLCTWMLLALITILYWVHVMLTSEIKDEDFII